MTTEPIIAVANVEESTRWYSDLIGCQGAHGGSSFEILTDAEGSQLLSLHLWGEHDHPTLREPIEPIGNGLILYFVVDDFDDAWERGVAMGCSVEREPFRNENSGRREFSLRDRDGYYVSVTENERVWS